jgi:hypothetical protein
MTTEDLEAQQARLMVVWARELHKLNGQPPPFGIAKSHPGHPFDDCQVRSWIVDQILADRFEKDLDAVVARHDASPDADERKALKARYDAIMAKYSALADRVEMREKCTEERIRVGLPPDPFPPPSARRHPLKCMPP